MTLEQEVHTQLPMERDNLNMLEMRHMDDRLVDVQSRVRASIREKSRCSVCMTGNGDALVLLSCGHRALCRPCADKILQRPCPF